MYLRRGKYLLLSSLNEIILRGKNIITILSLVIPSKEAGDALVGAKHVSFLT
jgi:hypothetical protein